MKHQHFRKIHQKGFLCILFLLLLNGHSLYAQSGWEEEPLSLKVSYKPLGQVLEELASRVKATILYQEVTLMGIDKPTSINIKNKPFKDIIEKLIGDQDVSIEYRADKKIVITPLRGTPNEKNKCRVEGFVYSEKEKDPLTGATVVVDGTTLGDEVSGCVTDASGKFSLFVKKGAFLKISYLGYETAKMQIMRPYKNMNIYLKTDHNEIDEVVVTGISKRSKSSFTGNYVSVKGENLRKLNPNNFLKGLQFFDPSFKILENNNRGSDPNAQPEFQMRGDQSLGGHPSMNSMDLMLDNVSSRPNTPLFVLDGFIVSLSRILQLDPERVENVTILKDAAATAIYGSRASNGVVVIETRVAPDGVLSVNYNGGVTMQAPDLTGYNMMNAAEKLQLEWDAGVYSPSSATSMNRYNMLKRNVLAGVDTYWLSQPLRTAWQQRHSISAAGGTDLFRYSLDLNATMNPGVMKGSKQNTKSINFNMTYRKEDFTVGANINLSESNGKNSPYGNFSSYTRINPYYRPTNEDGEYLQELDSYIGRTNTIIDNPLYNAHVGIKDLTNNTNITASLNIEYQLLKNLRLTEQVSYMRGMARSETFLPAKHTSFLTVTDKTLKGSYNKNTGEMTSWSSNFGVNWNLVLEKHLISVFGNWTINNDKNNYVVLSATGYPDVHMDDFILGNKMSTNPSGTESISRSMGLIGQLSYSYDNRYSADFNLSNEMSSRYADHKFTPFWSTGVRWNAHREKWLAKRISNLVFRATYGVTGEQNFSPEDAIEFYTFSNTMKPYTSFSMLGAVLSRLNNPALKWAKTHNKSLGIELGVWKNRINMTFNYYDNITKQLLTNYDLAPSTGFDTQIINAGELQNKGFDATVNVIAWQDLKNQIYWTLSAGVNHNKNKIRKISDFLRKMNEEQLASSEAPVPIYQEGKSTTTIYAVRSLGIDPMTGNEVFLTKNGEKTFTWNSVDKVPVGDTAPKASGTLSSAVNWKDLSCTIGFTYTMGGVLYNQTLVGKIENSNIAYNLDRRAAENRWRKPGDFAKYKRIALGGSETPASDRFIMNNNELRLASLNLGYRFRNEKFKFLQKCNINILSLNFTTNDLLRLSTIKMERGLSYPFSRSYTLSMSIVFK